MALAILVRVESSKYTLLILVLDLLRISQFSDSYCGNSLIIRLCDSIGGSSRSLSALWSFWAWVSFITFRALLTLQSLWASFTLRALGSSISFRASWSLFTFISLWTLRTNLTRLTRFTFRALNTRISFITFSSLGSSITLWPFKHFNLFRSQAIKFNYSRWVRITFRSLCSSWAYINILSRFIFL